MVKNHPPPIPIFFNFPMITLVDNGALVFGIVSNVHNLSLVFFSSSSHREIMWCKIDDNFLYDLPMCLFTL